MVIKKSIKKFIEISKDNEISRTNFKTINKLTEKRRVVINNNLIWEKIKNGITKYKILSSDEKKGEEKVKKHYERIKSERYLRSPRSSEEGNIKENSVRFKTRIKSYKHNEPHKKLRLNIKSLCNSPSVEVTEDYNNSLKKKKQRGNSSIKPLLDIQIDCPIDPYMLNAKSANTSRISTSTKYYSTTGIKLPVAFNPSTAKYGAEAKFRVRGINLDQLCKNLERQNVDISTEYRERCLSPTCSTNKNKLILHIKSKNPFKSPNKYCKRKFTEGKINVSKTRESSRRRIILTTNKNSCIKL